MKSKLVLLSLFLFPWGSMTQAWGQHCSCADKETLTINQAVATGGIALGHAVLPRLQSPAVIQFANAMVANHQVVYKELAEMSVNAGIPQKPNDIAFAATARATKAIQDTSTLSGAVLDRAYIESRVNELQILITAYDSYFIPMVTTSAMKAWLARTRPSVIEQYNVAKGIQKKI